MYIYITNKKFSAPKGVIILKDKQKSYIFINVLRTRQKLNQVIRNFQFSKHLLLFLCNI